MSIDAIEDLSNDHYKFFQRFLENTCGIVLGEGKHYLVKNRLHEVLRKLNLPSYSALVNLLQQDGLTNKHVKELVVDAMTTNETYWFRDDTQFEELKTKIFPELFKLRPSGIRIWSAACSSGQEPYTISICVEELSRKGTVGNVQILGTDISEAVIREANKAIYSDLAILRGLDVNAKNSYFLNTQEGGLTLRPEITRRVRFQQFNLLNTFVTLGRFDIIFCRNVLIYFSESVKADILKRMAASLNPGGYLFLSSTESMPADLNLFESIRGSRVRYFRKIS